MVEFAKNLAHFASSIGKKHVVILSSLDSGRRKKIEASRSVSSTNCISYIHVTHDCYTDEIYMSY